MLELSDAVVIASDSFARASSKRPALKSAEISRLCAVSDNLPASWASAWSIARAAPELASDKAASTPCWRRADN